MRVRSVIKQSLGTLTAALFVLAVAALASWTVGTRPRPDTLLDADLTALEDLGVATSVAELTQPSAANTVAAERYEGVSADFEAFIHKKGPRWYQVALTQKLKDQALKNAIAALESEEKLYSSLFLAAEERQFIPRQEPLLWDPPVDSAKRSRVVKAYANISAYLDLRMRVYAAAGRTQRALESLTLALRIAEQIGAHPGATSNSIARFVQESAYGMADELSETFPGDRKLQRTLLGLVELSRPVELRLAFLTQPAVAFSILDSSDQLPDTLVPPDLVTRGVPVAPAGPKNRELVNSPKVRREIKALLASHYRTLFEDFPQDETDSQTLTKLLHDDALEQGTLPAMVAKVLAGTSIVPSAANLTHKKRQQVIESIRSRIPR